MSNVDNLTVFLLLAVIFIALVLLTVGYCILRGSNTEHDLKHEKPYDVVDGSTIVSANPSYVLELQNREAKRIREHKQTLEYLEDAHKQLGFLSMHLRGRMGDFALTEMATKADAWRVHCEKHLGKESMK